MPEDATIFRLFLAEGSSLVSYGEPARVGDRVVFSMPTSASMIEPQLHTVNIAASRVDWPRTERYAEAARAARYLAGPAERDYASLTDDIALALNQIAETDDPRERLRVVERARSTLASWPAAHFNYKQDEIREMLGLLDEAIAELRAAVGAEQFDLSFVAMVESPSVLDALLPLPTPQEVIEQVLTASRLADSPVERVSLMTAVLMALDRDAARLPDEWTAAIRASTRAGISRELELDRQYRSLTTRVMRRAASRARAADVRGVQRLLTEVEERDVELGQQRPDAVVPLKASIESHLESARQLRLARDRWALRQPEFRQYNAAMSRPFGWLSRLESSLEDIKALAGPSAGSLATVEEVSVRVLAALAAISPPEEFRGPHALVVSAMHMASRAARLRREAAMSGDLNRAWDASSAAAGALMLESQARSEIRTLLRIPELPR
jgi:hypothetical protein